jgi:hypothetical protein
LTQRPLTALAGVMITDAVRRWLSLQWGAPSRNAWFKVGAFEAEVYMWAADSNPEDVDMYVTVGASARAMVGGDVSHRVEFFVGLRPGVDAVAGPLAALALHSAREGTRVDHGHTVTTEGPLWPGAGMDAFLVLSPRADIIPPLSMADGVHVEFLQAIPIFSSERAFQAQHGTEALLRVWEAAATPFWDPSRSPHPASNERG